MFFLVARPSAVASRSHLRVVERHRGTNLGDLVLTALRGELDEPGDDRRKVVTTTRRRR